MSHSPPRGFTVVTAAELAALQSGDAAPLVLEAGVDETPRINVLPSAVCVSLAEVDVQEVSDERGTPCVVSGNFSLRPPAELRRALEGMGVTHRRHVVVYTQAVKLGAFDLAVAARLAWCLRYAGVEHVSLLADGLSAWRAAGLPLSDTPAPRVAVADFFDGDASLSFPANPHFLASTAEVASTVAAADDAHAQLADVRSWEEFCGEGNGYPYPFPLGRIPTSHWAHWGPSTYIGGDFFVAVSGALLPLKGTEELWRQWGLDIGGRKRLLFYCGSGWRSSVAWCLAQLMGHTDCANFDGGFLEWAVLDEKAAERPIAMGAPSGVREFSCEASKPIQRPVVARCES